MKHYRASSLRKLPTLATGQADNLKVDDGEIRVWLSRMTKADGMPYNGQVTVERLTDGRWITEEEYRG